MDSASTAKAAAATRVASASTGPSEWAVPSSASTIPSVCQALAASRSAELDSKAETAVSGGATSPKIPALRDRVGGVHAVLTRFYLGRIPYQGKSTSNEGQQGGWNSPDRWPFEQRRKKMSNTVEASTANQSGIYAAFAAGVLAAPGVVPPRPDDEEGREVWRNEVRELLDDIESLVGARELSDDVLALINDPDFEDRKNKKRIVTGRVVAVSTLGGDLSVLALQNGWGRKIDLEEAQELWEEHYRDSGAHERDEGVLRNTYGIERFFLPDATTTAGSRMVRASKGLIGKHVRVWKQVEQYEDKNGEERDKRVAIHVDELPTDFTFRKRRAKKGSDNDSTGDEGARSSDSGSDGMTIEQWEDFVLDMEIAHSDIKVGDLIARCAKSLGKEESEWSGSDRLRAKKAVEKAAQRAAA